jgi:hypothetical protein
MDRHPGSTIIFLDVDCTVLGPLDRLAAIAGDLGLAMSQPGFVAGLIVQAPDINDPW